jgi:phosphoglycolate phosphatase
VLEQLAADPAATALVGDSPWDHEAGVRARLAGVYLVSTGTHSAEELRAHGAGAVYAALIDLRPRLLSLPPR